MSHLTLGHVLRKEDNDWVKKCMEYEVEGARQEVDQRELGECGTWNEAYNTVIWVNGLQQVAVVVVLS